MNDWAITARMRQGLYRFFGEALLPHRPDLWPMLQGAAERIAEFPVERYAFFRSWQRLHHALVERDEPGDLGSQYVKLFASGIDATLSPPVESYYRTRAKGGGTGQLLSLLEAEYREMGLVPGTEGPDHVSTQLEAMSTLCGREFAARGQNDDPTAHEIMHVQGRFLDRHLGAWLPAFAGRVRRSGIDGFYGGLVDAAHAYVIHDADFVRAAVAQEAGRS